MNLMDLIAGLQQQMQPASSLNPMPDQIDPAGNSAPLGEPDSTVGLGGGATDFSARARQPINIPLSGADPMGNPMGGGTPMEEPSPASFAPTGTQQGGGKGGLLSLIAPQLGISNGAINKGLASLGGGLSTVTGNTAGGAFARGMGGGLKSGTEFDKSDNEQMLKAVALAQKAKAAGDETAYKKALTMGANVLASLNQQRAKSLAEGKTISGGGERAARSLDSRLLFDKAERAIQSANRTIDGDFRLKPDEKAKMKAEQSARIYKGFGLNPDGTDAGGTKPTRNPAAKKAGKAGEIAFDGDGSQGSPYAPATKDDYDQIESGTYYIHPSSGEVRLKK